MAHDVFISYAVEDKDVANKVCDALERGGIECWIAPRDVPLGADYQEAIVDAIASSRLYVLVLSSHSNASPHVKREILCAYAEGYEKPVLPFRIEEVEYNKALSYYLGSAQWLDASIPPLEQHLGRLVEHARATLGSAGDSVHTTERTTHGAVPSYPPPAELMQNAHYALKSTGDGTKDINGIGDGRKPFPVKWVAVGAGALLLLLALPIYWIIGGSNIADGNAVNGNIVSGNSTGPADGNAVVPPSATPSLTATVNSPSPTRERMPTPTPRQSQTPTPLPTQRPTATATPPQITDEQIKGEIEKNLREHDSLKHVRVKVVNGVVTLTGSVPHASDKFRAITLSRVEGVHDVIFDELTHSP